MGGWGMETMSNSEDSAARFARLDRPGLLRLTLR